MWGKGRSPSEESKFIQYDDYDDDDDDDAIHIHWVLFQWFGDTTSQQSSNYYNNILSAILGTFNECLQMRSDPIMAVKRTSFRSFSKTSE